MQMLQLVALRMEKNKSAHLFFYISVIFRFRKIINWKYLHAGCS